MSNLHVCYGVHVQGYGDLPLKQDGEIAGTTGQSRRLEAIYIKIDRLKETFPGSSIEYKIFATGVGWMESSDGQWIGTKGQSRRTEAIGIKLVGEITHYYDIYYKVHIENIGWTDWVKNNQIAGIPNSHLRLEAIQIKLMAKPTEKIKPEPSSSSSSSSSPKTINIIYNINFNFNSGTTSNYKVI
ncbi:hypothetical protein BCR36DRAFT_416534 [Piromyces finnis]|uniref:Clostridial hydrophobic W n=1 Tax=Piromyces finnis TaxID=1754191 RepID=A0A1Y1UV20_9FUNG|nr:hypothetical protein BCR36DRAFT_416534 [Piromyces finnis]|eukprot:ORX41807.1 hypothetical protein BCR36DRAFT_416534 [Piromyces finnis]